MVGLFFDHGLPGLDLRLMNQRPVHPIERLLRRPPTGGYILIAIQHSVAAMMTAKSKNRKMHTEPL